jgi:hypothetical protein
MYLETMTDVLAPMNKVIVDDSGKGVVPYFQLPSMLKQQVAPQTPQPQPQASNNNQPGSQAQ